MNLCQLYNAVIGMAQKFLFWYCSPQHYQIFVPDIQNNFEGLYFAFLPSTYIY